MANIPVSVTWSGGSVGLVKTVSEPHLQSFRSADLGRGLRICAAKSSQMMPCDIGSVTKDSLIITDI